MDLTADVTPSSLGLLTELVTFRYGSAGFLHSDLTDADTPDEALILLAGEGGHRIAEGGESEDGAFVIAAPVR